MAKAETGTDPRLKGYKVDLDGTPTGPKLKWVVEFEVDPLWVADGFQLEDEVDEKYPDATAEGVINRLHSLYVSAAEGELGAHLVSGPDPALVRALQGYPEPVS